MKNSERIFNQAKDQGQVKERDNYLSLAPKNDLGVPTPNGPHMIILVADKPTVNNEGIEQMSYTVLEDGVQKIWNVKKWQINPNTAEKTLHYVVQTLASLDEGDKVTVEMKKNGAKNFVDIKKVGHEENIPTIQLDEELESDLPELHAKPERTQDTDEKSNPFED